MKRTYIMAALAIVALLIWIAQSTSFAFLPRSATDFVGGFAFGVAVGTAMAWWAENAGLRHV